MSEMNISNTAKWFLSIEPMTPKKLQKIAYYAYAWFLVLMNESEEDLSNRLFDQPFEAWVHGPANPDLYREYKSYGYREIPKYTGSKISFDGEVESVLNEVWEVYGPYSAGQLESISHQEEPWINARKGCSPTGICTNVISDLDIYRCYAARIS